MYKIIWGDYGMNIFKVLSSNDGSINEPNVSSFLAYLLDPNENHGLGSRFVESFLSPIVLNNKEYFKELIYNNRLRDLSRNSLYEVRVQAEVKVIIPNNRNKRRTRDIDILIEIYERKNLQSVPKYSFCIENKIKDGAIIKGENQLFEEITGLISYYNSPSITLEQPLVSFIFLTPATSKRAMDEFSELLVDLKEKSLSVPNLHMTWGLEEDSHVQDSIASLLTEILTDETKGKIEPIYEYTKHTIKSFISFIKSGFKSYKEEKTLSNEKNDYGKPVIQYIKDFYHLVEVGKDIEHNDLKKWVTDEIKKVSGLTIKSANFDGSYIVNERNRRYYGVNNPYKMEKNLFYYPDESNKKIIRKIDYTNLPSNIMVYWKDSECQDGLGKTPLTEVSFEIS